MKNILEIIFCIVEILVCFFYFGSVLGKNDKSKLFHNLLLCAIILINIGRSYLYLSFVYNILFTILIWIVVAFTCFEAKYSKKLFFIAVNILALIATEIITAMLLSTLHEIEYDDGFTMRYLGLIMSNSILFILDVYIIYFAKKKYRKLPTKFNILMLLCPIFSIYVLMLLDTYIAQSHNHYYVTSFIAVVGLGYINIMIFNFFDYYEKSLYASTAEAMLYASEENSIIRNDKDEEMYSLNHNISKHMVIIKEMIECDNREEADKYFYELDEYVSQYISVSRSGNSTLDSILNQEYKKANSLGIKYDIKINLSEELVIPRVCLGSLLYNAIDNAIEACEKVNEKYILISVSTKDNMLNILVENTSPEVEIHDNKISTTKKDKSKHGYGIISMKRVAEKCNGSVNLSYKNGIFSCSINVENRLKK